MGTLFIPFELVPLTPFHTNREANDNKLEYELDKLMSDSNTIVVAHAPPFGAGDRLVTGRKVGSISVQYWIMGRDPLIWLNGHIHEDFGVVKVMNTLVFNCACDYENNVLRGWIIDTSTLKYEKVEI